MVIVITEGGPKAQKKFKHLMLSRIKWSEDSAQGHKQDKIDKKNNDTSEKKRNECALLWEVGNETDNGFMLLNKFTLFSYISVRLRFLYQRKSSWCPSAYLCRLIFCAFC